MVFKVTTIDECTSKNGKQFFRLHLSDPSGRTGSYTVFTNDFKPGDTVQFTPTLAWSYGSFQWVILLEKVGK